MSSYMTKLEFPIETYMLFRLGKLPHIWYLLLHWVLLSFVDPYERFVMLLKSRSCTHQPNIHYSYTRRRRKICFPSRSTQKCSTPTLGVNTKNMLVRFPIHQINAQVLVAISQKFCCRKEAWAMQKLFIKKMMRKNGHRSVWDI